jgi:hypothetical protein
VLVLLVNFEVSLIVEASDSFSTTTHAGKNACHAETHIFIYEIIDVEAHNNCDMSVMASTRIAPSEETSKICASI